MREQICCCKSDVSDCVTCRSFTVSRLDLKQKLVLKRTFESICGEKRKRLKQKKNNWVKFYSKRCTVILDLWKIHVESRFSEKWWSIIGMVGRVRRNAHFTRLAWATNIAILNIYTPLSLENRVTDRSRDWSGSRASSSIDFAIFD